MSTEPGELPCDIVYLIRSSHSVVHSSRSEAKMATSINSNIGNQSSEEESFRISKQTVDM
jgi:hypothetical protein